MVVVSGCGRKHELTNNTPPTLQYVCMRDIYMKDGDGFLCVYGIDVRESFDEVKSFWNRAYPCPMLTRTRMSHLYNHLNSLYHITF